MNANTFSAHAFRQDAGIWEYLLAVQPDEKVREEIIAEKKHFHQVYSPGRVSMTKPYIAIAHFLAKEAMEETIVRWIQNICNLQKGFHVTLNNFSGIPSDSIYLRVQEPQPFQQLANQLKIIDGFIQSNDCPPVHLVTRPLLSLTGSLPEPIYAEAIKEYAQRSFHASFFVERIVLMRKEWEGGPCQLVNTFNLAVTPFN